MTSILLSLTVSRKAFLLSPFSLVWHPFIQACSRTQTGEVPNVWIVALLDIISPRRGLSLFFSRFPCSKTSLFVLSSVDSFAADVSIMLRDFAPFDQPSRIIGNVYKPYLVSTRIHSMCVCVCVCVCFRFRIVCFRARRPAYEISTCTSSSQDVDILENNSISIYISRGN